MSMLLRRSLARAAPRARQFSTATEGPTQKAYFEKLEDSKHHAAGTFHSGVSPVAPALTYALTSDLRYVEEDQVHMLVFKLPPSD